MTNTKTLKGLLLAVALMVSAMAPMMAQAQSLGNLQKEIERRQQKKNEWRNIAYIAAAAGVYGLLKNDKTLFFAGTAGALYSAHRYEQDRKSQSKLQRTRANIFSRTSFVRDGKTYTRRTVTKNGKKYYQFVRAK